MRAGFVANMRGLTRLVMRIIPRLAGILKPPMGGIKKKMELIVKGVEEKKNKEIAQLRDEIESELRADWEVYTNKMVNPTPYVRVEECWVIGNMPPLFRSR